MELQLLLYGWPHQKNLMNILSQLRSTKAAYFPNTGYDRVLCVGILLLVLYTMTCKKYGECYINIHACKHLESIMCASYKPL